MDSKHKIVNLPDEEWRDVVGFEGRYMVSNYGRVKSLPNQTRSDERLLKQHIVRNYYSVPLLCVNGKKKTVRVHRLVAFAFIPNPLMLEQVNHKDEDKLNNFVDNLEWCDAAYNRNYGTLEARRLETYRRNNSGKPRPYKYKPIEMLTMDGSVIAKYDSIQQAAKKTGYPYKIISQACCRYVEGGKQRRNKYPYKWRHAK